MNAALLTVLLDFARDDILKAITKANDHDPMSLRHKKFWGQDMESEEAIWQSENAEMLKAHVVDVEDNEDEGEASEDEEREGPFVDYRKGFYAIRFGEELQMPVTNIWVRADYLLLYDRIEQHYQGISRLSQSGVVVLTGQPGCG
jgi:hypothetical protein